MSKTQQSQLDEEELLGLCSAKVVSNNFIDNDECDKDDDNLPDNRFDADDGGDPNDEEIENETTDVGRCRLNLKAFIEDQAELSDDDKGKFSSDEEEESNDEYEQDEIDKNLPSEQEILKANNKMFL